MNTQTKNQNIIIVEAITNSLSAILKVSIKSKYYKQVMTAINDATAQQTLVQIIKDNMPVTKKTKKPKKPKDPEAPKKPLTSYIRFCNDNRDKIRKKNPSLKGTDVIKKLGSDWKELKDSKKKKYTDLYLADKERYAKEMKSYTPSPEFKAQLNSYSDSDSAQGKKKKRTKKKITGPKRSSSAYIWFCKEMRQQVKVDNPEMDNKELLKELGRLWSEYKLDDKKRKPFENFAKKDKERYIKEKASWVSVDDDDAKSPVAKSPMHSESDSESDSESKKSKKKSKKKSSKKSKKKSNKSETKYESESELEDSDADKSEYFNL